MNVRWFDLFAPLRGHAREFYEGVRCGILHQAETTLGWRIRREGQLLASVDGVRTINARTFVKALRKALDGYRDLLKAAAWEDDVWKNLRKKMKRASVPAAARSRKVPDNPLQWIGARIARPDRRVVRETDTRMERQDTPRFDDPITNGRSDLSRPG